jgi:hypothetical protein
MIAKSSLTKGTGLVTEPLSGTGFTDVRGHNGIPDLMPRNSDHMGY